MPAPGVGSRDPFPPCAYDRAVSNSSSESGAGLRVERCARWRLRGRLRRREDVLSAALSDF
eukprot:442299-Rhodomonas_salina.1